MWRRVLHVESFADGSGFAFNSEDPGGVKYLNPAALSLLQGLILKFGSPPRLPSSFAGHPQASELARHGLATIDGVDRPVNSRHRPRTLSTWLHIANVCNLSCSYCYIPKLHKAASPDVIATEQMPTGIAVGALKQLVNYCTVTGFQRLQVKFAGGEPTLNQTVVEEVGRTSLELSRSSGIAVDLRMLTNGVFDHAKWIPVIKRYNIGISISVDGAPQDHDRRRFLICRSEDRTPQRISRDRKNHVRVQREGTWRVVDQTIVTLVNEGIKPYLLCTVDESNFGNLDILVEYCQKLKLGFRLSPVRNRRSQARPELQQTMAESLGRLYDKIGVEYPINMPIERFARFSEWNLEVSKKRACGTCHSMLAVDQQGGLSSCQMRMSVPFGNVENDDVGKVFARIRSAPENHWLVGSDANTGDCAICDWRNSCAGGCPEHKRQVFGTVNHASPWCGVFRPLMPRYLRAVATQIKRAVTVNK